MRSTLKASGDSERDGRHGDDADVDEHAHGAHDERGDGDGRHGEVPSERVDDRAGEAFRAAGLDERAHEDARGEDAQDGGRHPLHARDGVRDRVGEAPSAGEAADEGTHHERVGGLHAQHDERDGQSQSNGCAKG